MRSPIARIGFAAVALLLAAALRSQERAAARLEALFTRLHDQGRFDGVVIVAERGRVVYEGCLGLANDATKAPLSTESAFDYASVGKPILAVAILRLVQRGLCGLDDPVAKHLREWPYARVTLRHLLNHTSGLLGHDAMFERYRDRIAREVGSERQAVTNADVVRFLVGEQPPAAAAPGAVWDYNNVNYIVLGYLFERLAGIPIGAALRREVFAPAGMRGAFVIPDHTLAGEPAPNLVADYVRDPQDTRWLPAQSAPGFEFLTVLGGTVGDGGIAGTARDLLAFDRALANGTLLGEGMLREAFAPAVLADGTKVENRSWVVTSYGLGWTLAADGSSVWHTGDWGGFLTCCKRYLATDRTLVYLLNRRRDDWSWLGDVEAILTAEQPLLPEARDR